MYQAAKQTGKKKENVPDSCRLRTIVRQRVEADPKQRDAAIIIQPAVAVCKLDCSVPWLCHLAMQA